MIKFRESAHKNIMDQDMYAEGAVIFHGIEDAITGIDQNGFAIYSYEEMIKIFMNDGMTDEEAMEWIDYNVLGTNAGQGFVIHYSYE